MLNKIRANRIPVEAGTSRDNQTPLEAETSTNSSTIGINVSMDFNLRDAVGIVKEFSGEAGKVTDFVDAVQFYY